MKKYITLGDLIKDYRRFSDTSQVELASNLDVDVRSVIRWEKNETLLSSEKESLFASYSFIPSQVIRNLNSLNQIPTFYDFNLRKYSLSKLSSKLPDADWIKSRMAVSTNRLQKINRKEQLPDILRFIELQKNPLKSKHLGLFIEAAKALPELNLILYDQSGNYAGHCLYFPLDQNTYNLIKNRTITEKELRPSDFINYQTQKKPVFYCHSITADCNENFFYIIGAVLKFFNDLGHDDYLYALLTSRYDSHQMSNQLGVKTIWQDENLKKSKDLIDAPRLVEGTFKHFLEK